MKILQLLFLLFFTACLQDVSCLNAACSLPPVTGPCKAAFPRFFFNATSGHCEHFTYGGCDGNKNDFETQVECENTCSKLVTKISPRLLLHLEV